MSIFLTGSSGFVGKNFITYFNNYYKIRTYNRQSNISITEEIVVHFAGKAHDLKKTSNSKEYYEINTELTKDIFDSFLNSNAKVFIILSSVKAVADVVDGELTEDHFPNPKTHYGKSKLLAEKYITSKINVKNKRIYILRPCMIHGPGNKGNLNLLYKFVSMKLPWVLGDFDNQRSFCSINNLLFVIGELIKNESISSGIYNIADDVSLSTNEVIRLISKSTNNRPIIWRVSKRLIKSIAKLGDIINLPLNSERLKKITESYVVSNKKIMKAIGKELPICSVKGLLETFESFKK
ncbi:NAD-dependent epimerase/dehydratase family protein [bacterium]|nr:NAD-dependent epimerase/dehydratase family protein [bacterium]